jgi:hypothetical protein
VSSFESDETFAPGTIHLAPGRYAIDVAAPDYKRATRTLDVISGGAQIIEIALDPLHAHRRASPTLVMGAGVALGVLGAAFDEFEVQPLRVKMAKSLSAWQRNSGTWDAWTGATIGCWVGGAIAIGIGVWLARQPHRVDVSARFDRSGAAIMMEWRR